MNSRLFPPPCQWHTDEKVLVAKEYISSHLHVWRDHYTLESCRLPGHEVTIYIYIWVYYIFTSVSSKGASMSVEYIARNEFTL